MRNSNTLSNCKSTLSMSVISLKVHTQVPDKFFTECLPSGLCCTSVISKMQFQSEIYFIFVAQDTNNHFILSTSRIFVKHVRGQFTGCGTDIIGDSSKFDKFDSTFN